MDGDRRRAFVELAERALGPAHRAGVIATLCAKRRIDEVTYFAEGAQSHVRVTTSSKADEGDPLSKIRIELARDPAQQWRYVGTFEYGVAAPRELKNRLGGGDYDRAVEALRAQATAP